MLYKNCSFIILKFKNKFYTLPLICIRLNCLSARQSSSEYGAIVKAYMECLRYAISQSITEGTDLDSQSMQTYLIQDQVSLATFSKVD